MKINKLILLLVCLQSSGFYIHPHMEIEHPMTEHTSTSSRNKQPSPANFARSTNSSPVMMNSHVTTKPIEGDDNGPLAMELMEDTDNGPLAMEQDENYVEKLDQPLPASPIISGKSSPISVTLPDKSTQESDMHMSQAEINMYNQAENDLLNMLQEFKKFKNDPNYGMKTDDTQLTPRESGESIHLKMNGQKANLDDLSNSMASRAALLQTSGLPNKLHDVEQQIKNIDPEFSAKLADAINKEIADL